MTDKYATKLYTPPDTVVFLASFVETGSGYIVWASLELCLLG